MGKYTIVIQDEEDDTFNFSVEGDKDTDMDIEDLASLLVQVAEILIDEADSRTPTFIH